MNIYLRKINPDTNCFRFYCIRIDRDLFAERSLSVHWGRIGTAGRQQVRGSGSAEEVERIAGKILKLRLRHGYAET